MPEFFIAILLIFLPNGQVSMETLPFEHYAECRQVTQAAEAAARAQIPGADVRSSCVSSESIGQMGV